MQVPLRPLDNPTNTSQRTACTSPGSVLKKHPRSPRSHFGKNSAANRPVLPVTAAPAMENSLKEVNRTNPYLISVPKQHKHRTKSPAHHTHRKKSTPTQSLCFH